MSRQLITLCDSCAEKMRENYVLTDLGWVPGQMCTWAGCGNSPVKQYEFESKAEIRRRERSHRAKRETRADGRGRRREE